MPEYISTACADCGKHIVLTREQVILDFLAHLLGNMAEYRYVCPDCWH